MVTRALNDPRLRLSSANDDASDFLVQDPKNVKLFPLNSLVSGSFVTTLPRFPLTPTLAIRSLPLGFGQSTEFGDQPLFGHVVKRLDRLLVAFLLLSSQQVVLLSRFLVSLPSAPNANRRYLKSPMVFSAKIRTVHREVVPCLRCHQDEASPGGWLGRGQRRNRLLCCEHMESIASNTNYDSPSDKDNGPPGHRQIDVMVKSYRN